MATVLAPRRTTPNKATAGIPDDLIWKLSVEQYHQMIRAGILDQDDPVELLDGFLVFKMPKNPPHRVSTELTRQALAKITPAGWHVVAQDAVTTDTSEPEPDVVVVRGAIRDYSARHPSPRDTALVVEVADSSLARDRGWKKEIYARAGVPVYWIVNLIDNCVEAYTGPSGPSKKPDYRKPEVFGPKDRIPVILDGKEIGRIRVKDILP